MAGCVLGPCAGLRRRRMGMRDIRCALNWHHWQRRQNPEGDTWAACSRCGKEKHSAAVGWYGRNEF